MSYLREVDKGAEREKNRMSNGDFTKYSTYYCAKKTARREVRGKLVFQKCVASLLKVLQIFHFQVVQTHFYECLDVHDLAKNAQFPTNSIQRKLFSVIEISIIIYLSLTKMN